MLLSKLLFQIEFRSKEFRIERFRDKFDGNYNQNSYISIFRADLIDRVAVFNINDCGFQVFILMKGNPREYRRRHLRSTTSHEFLLI